MEYLKAKKRLVTICFILMIITVILFLFSTKGISGNDFWWHVKTGEWVVNNGIVPQTDPFSWYGIDNNLPWIAHEWLSGCIFYFVYKYVGQHGIFLLCMILAIIMSCFLILSAKKYLHRKVLFGILYIFSSLVGLVDFFWGRPHIFSFFLLFFTLYCLYGFLNGTKKKLIYFIPIISFVWANLHGGSSNLPYILILIAIFSSSFNLKIGKIEARKLHFSEIKKLIVVCILSIFVIMLNPYGVNMVVYPYQNMADNLMLSAIVEWGAPDPKVLSNLIFYYIPVFLAILSFVGYKKKIDLFDILMFAFFAFMFLRSVRFISLFVISSYFYVFKYAPIFRIKLKVNFNSVTKGCIGVAIVYLIIGGYVNVSFLLKTDEVIVRNLDNKVIELIKEKNPSKLYNCYNYGGDLIFNGIKTFVDGRADIFSKYNLNDYLSLQSIGKDVQELAAHYQFDGYLVCTYHSLFYYLKSHEEKYDLIYEDDVCAYFESKV